MGVDTVSQRSVVWPVLFNMFVNNLKRGWMRGWVFSCEPKLFSTVRQGKTVKDHKRILCNWVAKQSNDKLNYS